MTTEERVNSRFDKILEAIEEMKLSQAYFNTKLDKLDANNASLKESLDQSVNKLEDKIDSNNTKLEDKLDANNSCLKEQLDHSVTELQENITRLDESRNIKFNKQPEDVQKKFEEITKSVGINLRRYDERFNKFSEQVDNNLKNVSLLRRGFN